MRVFMYTDMDFGGDVDSDFGSVETDTVDGEAISADVLDNPIVEDVDIPEMPEADQESFDEFTINEALDNGILDENELHEIEEKSLSEIEDALNVQEAQEIPAVSKSEAEWLIEEGDLTKEELTMFRDGLDSGSIRVEEDEIPEEPEGVARVRKR